MPKGVLRDYPLSRLTTVRTGGPAQFFALAKSGQILVELLSWAKQEGHPITVIGSGSNTLVSDGGVKGLVLKSEGALTEMACERASVVCGGGARLPQVSSYAARKGLSGIEFGVNIPGTVGGAIRMNANAYGGNLEQVLAWVDVATAAGIDRREPHQLGFGYRSSNLQNSEMVVQARFQLSPGDRHKIKATMEAMRSRRRQAQPSGIKTFGSTFKNPDPEASGGRSAGQLLDHIGISGRTVGGARFSPKHANFIENTGNATTADILELMAIAVREALDRTGVRLEPEVQLIGEVEIPESLSWG